MPTSKMFSLNSYDFKSIIKYVFYVGCLVYLANETGVREYLLSYINQPTLDILTSILGIIIKKFLEDYSNPIDKK